MEDKAFRMFCRIYESLDLHLNEKQRRLLLGIAADFLGSGGLKLVCETTGAAKDTVIRGKKEIRGELDIKEGRTRLPGGGRKKKKTKTLRYWIC